MFSFINICKKHIIKAYDIFIYKEISTFAWEAYVKYNTESIFFFFTFVNQSQFVLKELLIFSRQKCSNFFSVWTNFDFKTHTNEIQYVQLQNNVRIVEKLTSSFYAVKFLYLYEEPELNIMQSRVIFFYTCKCNHSLL